MRRQWEQVGRSPEHLVFFRLERTSVSPFLTDYRTDSCDIPAIGARLASALDDACGRGLCGQLGVHPDRRHQPDDTKHQKRGDGLPATALSRGEGMGMAGWRSTRVCMADELRGAAVQSRPAACGVPGQSAHARPARRPCGSQIRAADWSGARPDPMGLAPEPPAGHGTSRRRFGPRSDEETAPTQPVTIAILLPFGGHFPVRDYACSVYCLNGRIQSNQSKHRQSGICNETVIFNDPPTRIHTTRLQDQDIDKSMELPC